MNSSENTLQELRELIEKALDGTISTAELVRLDDCITHNPKHRQYYCEYLYMTIGLTRLFGYTAPITGVEEYDKLYFESLLNALFLEEKTAQALTAKEWTDMAEVEHTPEEDQKTDIPKVSRFLIGTAAACLMALLFIITFARLYQMLIPREIATLTTSLNATFADNQSVVSGTRILNRKAPSFLQTGLIEIVFDKEAEVVLEAPASFRLKSANRMVLYEGQLYAFVPDFAHGFTVETPNSRIIDMGTEFGIWVEQNGTSNLHLFKGKATLTPDSGSKARQPLTLMAGQAKHVDVSGQVSDIPIQEQAFVQHFCSDTGFVWRGQRLCLVDLVGRGNGLGTGKTNIYVNPIEGYTESFYCYGKGNEYHTLAANPFIDGLFIPDGSKRQIVSSQGHEFADCPKTNGECYTTLGADPNQGVWATDVRNGIIQFEGQEYGDQRNPCLAMHANLGITFDLNAIRAMCPGIKMSRFVSKIGIADFKEHTGCNADFWILIDGQIRECWRNVKQKNVLRNVSTEIKPFDRFLTLVTTDGGDIDRLGYYQRSYTCDWCVFVEPALILEKGDDIANIRKK